MMQMTKLKIVVLLLTWCVFSIASEDSIPVTTSNVIALNAVSFDDTQQGTWLVAFVAPWCNQCKKLEPIWEQTASKLKELGTVKVAKVDVAEETDIAQRFSVKNLPTIKLYKDGQTYEYKGEKSVTAFTQFVTAGYLKASNEQSVKRMDDKMDDIKKGEKSKQEPQAVRSTETPTFVVTLTDSNFDALTSKGEWLIKFYAPWCGHCKRLAPTFERVAASLKGTTSLGKVDCTVHKELAQRFGVRGYPTLLHFSNGQYRNYVGDRTEESLEEFARIGWKDADARPVPKSTNPNKEEGLKESIGKAFGTVESKLQREKLWVAIAAAFVFGVLVGKCAFGAPVHVQRANPKKEN